MEAYERKFFSTDFDRTFSTPPKSTLLIPNLTSEIIADHDIVMSP